MKKNLKRREFLERIGAGAAIVSLPPFFLGCTKRSGVVPPPVNDPKPPVQAPRLDHFEQFGVDAPLLRRTLAKGLSRGGDFSEVFLQHQIKNWVGMEDGQVNQAYSRVGLGAGIRVLKGDATGFAYCEELTEDALLAAAATAAAVADGPPQVRPAALAVVKVKNAYPVEVPWAAIGIDKKVPIVTQAEAIA